jgi:hypothetical protein
VDASQVDDRARCAGGPKSLDLDDVHVRQDERGVDDGGGNRPPATTTRHSELEHVALEAIEAMKFGSGLVTDNCVGPERQQTDLKIAAPRGRRTCHHVRLRRGAADDTPLDQMLKLSVGYLDLIELPITERAMLLARQCR